MSDKIINTFQARRKLNDDLLALADTESEGDLLARVRGIAQSYEPFLILSTLCKYLDNSNSQLRGGLGRLATLLPYDETVSALRKEAANRHNPTQTRITAAMILERFLQAELSPGMMSDLKDPETVVMQSLQEALAESHENPYILLEYVRQMRQENEQVAQQVMDLLSRLDGADQVKLLRLIAYDARPGVARSAVERLGLIRQGAAATTAAGALFVLQQNLPPELAQVAERNRRKLNFSGVHFQASPLEGWRGLITPAALDGTQDLWFVQAREEDANGDDTDGNDAKNIVIGLRINRGAGVLDAFGSEDVEPQYLPPVRQVGELVTIALSGDTPSVFLEAPPGYALWLLRQALAGHWSQAEPRPLPDEYTFYNPHLCGFEAPPLPEAMAGLLESGPSLWAAEEARLEERAKILLRHPVMAGWFFQNTRMLAVAGELPLDDSVAFDRAVAELAGELFTEEIDDALRVEVRAGLLAQAGWLQVAGFTQHAQHAMLLAEGFRHMAASHHPLMALMLEVGLALLLKRRVAGEADGEG